MFALLAFAAGLVRGYSGFGFAMLLALGLLTRLSPAQVVPVALMLDLACSVSLWPGALRSFHVPIGSRLIVGMLLAVPLGAGLLSVVPGAWMTPVIALLSRKMLFVLCSQFLNTVASLNKKRLSKETECSNPSRPSGH